MQEFYSKVWGGVIGPSFKVDGTRHCRSLASSCTYL